MDHIELTAAAARAYGVRSTQLFKALRLDRLTSAQKSAGARNGPTFFSLTKDGVDVSRVEWSVINWRDEMDVPDVAPARLASPDGRWDCSDVRAVVLALMNVFDCIKPFAHFSMRAGAFPRDLGCGFDISPLISLDACGIELASRVLSTHIDGISPERAAPLLDDPYGVLSFEFKRFVEAVFGSEGGERPLLSNAAAAAVKHWTDFGLAEISSRGEADIIKRQNAIGFTQATRRMLALLYKRLLAVANGDRRAQMARAVDAGAVLLIRLSLVELLDAGYGSGAMRLSARDALAMMSDEAEEAVRGRLAEVFRDFQDTSAASSLPMYSALREECRRERVATRYRSQDKKFLTLGDTYGDCTASAPSNQVDASVTNIHWTVYPWALVPTYRVVEAVTPDGRPLIKAHIMPLVVEGRRVLMVDAIETVPALREESGATFSRRSFDSYAMDAFDALMARCVEIAQRCGAEAAYADMYSNAVWVRRLLETRYQHDSYCTANVEVPFSSYEVEDSVCLIKQDLGAEGSTPRSRMEVQAVNTALMHQGAVSNYKICAVLWGLRGDWSVRVRGL